MALFVTCVNDMVTPEVPVAVVQVLRGLGCEVSCPSGQTCCGQPAWNAGFVAEAAKVARSSLEALEADPGATVVVPAGSCATMIRLYWPQMFELAGDPQAAARARRTGERVREFTEFVAASTRDDGDQPGPNATTDPRPVAYHHSCHMTRELHLLDEPLEVLRRVGCEPVAWPDAQRCCGFGGAFSVKLPEVSVAMADEKLASLPAGTTEIVGADSSCLLHLAARAGHQGTPVRVRHVAEVLADANAESGGEP